MELFKGYLATNNKKANNTWKNGDLLTLEQVENRKEYSGVLAENALLLDVDDAAASEIVMNIVEDLQLNCLVKQTTRGRHFYFRNDGTLEKCKTHVTIACGLDADFKVGASNSYAVLKFDGVERFTEWEPEEEGVYDALPVFFRPIKGKAEFMGMKAGDGRNTALFTYILTLQREGYTTEEIRETIRIVNKYVLPDPLSEDEVETVLRDEAFKQPAFIVKGKFLHDKFAQFLMNEEQIIKVNGQLHCYEEGVYVQGNKRIEAKMISHIPNLKDTQRKEVLKYLDVLLPNITQTADARYIAFENGILDIVTGELLDFNPETIITNKIHFDYDANAYHELTDNTLNKLACGDLDVRAVIEECAGYCLYRRNELGKAFILTGDKSNGKSTFLDMIKTMLGNENVSSLDLQELGDRFSSAMMFGKLANIGDDIADDFMKGREVAMFKKIVTGNRIKAEMKGQDPFDFEPYVKLLFSANDIPRMKDKTGAGIRRLVIIPFNATFSKNDPDFDPWIKYKLCADEAIQYLIRLAVEGLCRVLANKEFTSSDSVERQLSEYEKENNPIISFVDSVGFDAIENELTTDVYRRYALYCSENGYSVLSMIQFSKALVRQTGLQSKPRKLNGKTVRVYMAD